MKPSCKQRQAWLRSILATLLAALIMLADAAPARAGAIAPCDAPQVFSGAAVNAVILPYRYTGSRRFEMLGEAAGSLARLVQLEVLFSLLKHGSIGAVELQQNEPGGCDVDRVLELLTQRHGEGRLAPGHGLIVLWGRIYEEGDNLYLQSYLKFLRRDRDEIVTFSPSAEGREVFVAPLPAQALAFAPRRLSRDDLDAIIAEFSRAAVIRPEPDLSQPGTSLATWDPWQRFAYWVTEPRNGWLHIQEMEGPRHGWVQARGDETTSPLRRKMPELAFLDAVAGYLRFQVGYDASDVPQAPRQTPERIAAALTDHARGLAPDEEPLASAVGRAMQGLVLLRTAPRDASHKQVLARAADLFAQTRKLVPYNAAARNLDFVGQIIRTTLDSASASPNRALTVSLLDAVALEPGNDLTLANLENLYRYFRAKPALNPFSAEELSDRLGMVVEIRRSPSR